MINFWQRRVRKCMMRIKGSALIFEDSPQPFKNLHEIYKFSTTILETNIAPTLASVTGHYNTQHNPCMQRTHSLTIRSQKRRTSFWLCQPAKEHDSHFQAHVLTYLHIPKNGHAGRSRSQNTMNAYT